ncbi:MAG: tetratricopeptide repeat protein [Draconibacterium sp.]|nr:tetratricopeptide repeat protein [Draconibacterium sp.]
MIKKYLFIYILLLSPVAGFAQSQLIIDSLQVELEDAENEIEEAEILLQLSRSYWKTNYQKSAEFANEAIDILEDEDFSSIYAKAYRYLGNSYLFAGNYNVALEKMFVSLNIAREIQDNFELFAIAISIAGVYDRLENFDEAMKYLFEALRAVKNSKGTKDEEKIAAGTISLYNNLGNNYLSKNELEKAEEYYLNGLSLAEKRADVYNQGTIQNNLGKVYATRNDSLKALYYFRKSEETRTKSHDKSGLAVTYYFIGEFFMNTKNYDESIRYGTKSYKLGKEVGALLTQRTAAEILAESYKEQGDFKNAYFYHRIFKNLSDSILDRNTISEIARLKFLNEQAIIDNQLLKEKQKVRNRSILIISALFIGLLILASLLLTSKNRHRSALLEKKEFENSIVHKKKQLATNVLYLLRKNETIESVTKKLLELKKNVSDSNKALVQRIIMELENEIDTNSWKEFELRFQDVHQNFYEKMQALFPDLTPSERKLAAFLKLNMSSKEISVITGQSIRSLEVARYRLRKKLGITNQDINLINFLSGL